MSIPSAHPDFLEFVAVGLCAALLALAMAYIIGLYVEKPAKPQTVRAQPPIPPVRKLTVPVERLCHECLRTAAPAKLCIVVCSNRCQRCAANKVRKLRR